MEKIRKLTNGRLMDHFRDAVCDNNYNPSDEDYNKSGFTLCELQDEILRRMTKDQEQDNTEND